MYEINKKKEKTIVVEIFRMLEQEFGGWFIKTHGGAFSVIGVPDILGVTHGHFVGLEVKRPVGGRVSDMQAWHLERIRQAGGIADVVRSAEEARALLTAGIRRSP